MGSRGERKSYSARGRIEHIQTRGFFTVLPYRKPEISSEKNPARIVDLQCLNFGLSLCLRNRPLLVTAEG